MQPIAVVNYSSEERVHRTYRELQNFWQYRPINFSERTKRKIWVLKKLAMKRDCLMKPWGKKSWQLLLFERSQVCVKRRFRSKLKLWLVWRTRFRCKIYYVLSGSWVVFQGKTNIDWNASRRNELSSFGDKDFDSLERTKTFAFSGTFGHRCFRWEKRFPK